MKLSTRSICIEEAYQFAYVSASRRLRGVNWVRANAIFVIFLVAVVASFVVSNQESARRDSVQRAQLVSGCSRTGEARILNAAYKQKTSDVRRAAGTPPDIKAADAYELFALGEANLVPLPAKVEAALRERKFDLSKALIDSIELGRDAAGKQIYQLTPKAKAVIRAGCVEAYAPH